MPPLGPTAQSTVLWAGQVVDGWSAEVDALAAEMRTVERFIRGDVIASCGIEDVFDDQVTRATDRLAVRRSEHGTVRDLELQHQSRDTGDEADCAVAVVDRATAISRTRRRGNDRLPGRSRREHR